MSALPRLDPELATRTGRLLVPRGPEVTEQQVREVVADLHRDSALATGHVATVTSLDAPVTSPVLVVDRAGWIAANAASFSRLLADLDAGPGVTGAVGGIQLGALLSWLSPRVLGQFDPFHVGADGARGRLLLVAPNVVHIERELKVSPRDFRLWVCLHEETHRVQFGHAPWLPAHLESLIAGVLRATDVTDLGDLSRRLTRAGSARSTAGSGSLVELVTGPHQAAQLDRVTAIMSVLEGHADVVMDEVGPRVIPSVTGIRAAFDRRRHDARGLSRLIRGLLGLDAKLAQYREGAAFVRATVAEVGMTGFNEVFAGPDQMPTLAELRTPRSWLDRVHG